MEQAMIRAYAVRVQQATRDPAWAADARRFQRDLAVDVVGLLTLVHRAPVGPFERWLRDAVVHDMRRGYGARRIAEAELAARLVRFDGEGDNCD